MAKATPIQSNFSGGEFSPNMEFRVDNQRYATGLKTCLNYIPLLQGGVTRRPGTVFVAEVKDSTKATRLIPFRFNTSQAYIIELGNLYARFYRNDGQIEAARTITGITQASPAVVTAANHEFVAGQTVVITGVAGMTQVNGVTFTVANPTTNTFQLQGINSTGFGAYTSGGVATGVYEIATPFAEADLFRVRFAQSTDTLFLAHELYAPRKLTRVDHDRWTLTTIDFLDGPYLATNTTATTLTFSNTTGNITVTASSIVGINGGAGFKSTDVGRLIRTLRAGVQGHVKITQFLTTTTVNATVRSTLANGIANTDWRLGIYSTTTGFPRCVSLHEDRTVWGGPTAIPDRLDFSNRGDFENFAPSGAPGTGGTTASATVSADNAISVTLNTSGVNAILWMKSDDKGLEVGTFEAEYLIRPDSTAQSLTSTDVSARRTSTYGSSPDVYPVQVGRSVLFVQRSARKLRENTFFIDSDGFKATDLTLISDHITESGLKEIDFAADPQPIVWCVRNDGLLSGMTFERDVDQLRVSWHRHALGGKSTAGGDPAKAKSVAVIPSPDGTYDEVWLIGQWLLNGQSKQMVCYMEKFFEGLDWQPEAYHVDLGLQRDVRFTISAVTKANPAVVTTTAAHGFANGDTVFIYAATGMTQINNKRFEIAGVTATTFQLVGVNSTAFGTYGEGGKVSKCVASVSGLDHLIGETVAIFGDGGDQDQRVVDGSGALVISPASALIQAGLPMTSDLQTLRFEAGQEEGTAMGKTRRIARVGFGLRRLLGMQAGPDFTHLKQLVFRQAGDTISSPPPLFSGVFERFEIDSDYDYDNTICIRQSGAGPGTILSIFPVVNVYE